MQNFQNNFETLMQSFMTVPLQSFNFHDYTFNGAAWSNP